MAKYKNKPGTLETALGDTEVVVGNTDELKEILKGTKFDKWYDGMERMYSTPKTSKPMKIEEEILNWDMLKQEVKDEIIGLTEQYGVEGGLRIHNKMSLMDSFEKRKKGEI